MKKLLFIIFALVLITACGTAKTDGNKTKKLTVKTFIASKETTGKEQSFTFISKPYRTSLLSFRVGGVVERFEAHVGSHYRKGDVIATIDARDFKIRAERAEALYQQAEAEFNRIDILFKNNNISASVYEKAKAELVSARTNHQTAANELSDTQLIAPFDGYVGELFIEKFQDVKATQTVITFVEIDRLKIETYVPQAIALNPSAITSATISFDGSPNENYDVTIAEISKSTTRNNISYLLTALLENKTGELLSGMSGKINIYTNGTQSITIPQDVVRNRPSVGNFVWIIDPVTNKVSRQVVTLGAVRDGGLVTVINGISEGDIVATTNIDFLGEGEVVEISK